MKNIEELKAEFSEQLSEYLKIHDIEEFAYDQRLDKTLSFFIHCVFETVFDLAISDDIHEDTTMQILHYYLHQR